MPSYSNIWDEAKPAGSRALSLGDDDIREFKSAIRERLATDHKFASDETGITTIGYHTKATLIDSASNQAAVTGCGVVFSKTIAGGVELFYVDAAGNVTQLTSGGSAADSVRAKTGDWMLSSVTTARSGWTNVSSTYQNKFMRIHATPLSTGGSDTDSITLTTAELPAHSHTYTFDNSVSTGATIAGGGTTANDSASTASSGSGAAFTVDTVPAFVQVVVFQKD